LTDVYISHASQDARWAKELADGLSGHGLSVFHDECITLGDVIVHARERKLSEATCGIAVITSAWLAAPLAGDEYAALVSASQDRDLRLIPVLAGNADLPPFAANRVWRDFRNLSGQTYADKVAELAAAISGQQSDSQLADTLGAVGLTKQDPLTPPERRTFVVCYAAGDIGYARKLIGWLRAAGLPVWSVADLLPGDNHVWIKRQQLKYAIAVIVLMSPQSQDTEDITLSILEGQVHSRPFIPFLLAGKANYHLASTWPFDARDGRLPGDDLLRRLRDAAVGDNLANLAKMPPARPDQPIAPPVHMPHGAGLDRLGRYLGAREFGYADLHTTSLVLQAANRLSVGWLRERDGHKLPGSLLTGIDALWSFHTGGRQGFTAQLALAQVRRGRQAEFRALSVACGWQDNENSLPSRSYQEFSERAGQGMRAGFYPTLRNPQCEQRHDWYDRWTATVLAAHLRLNEWEETT
jgi:hypothetical protein